MEFRNQIVEAYDGLYGSSGDAEDGFGHRAAFGRKWGTYQSILALAQDDVRRVEEVTKLPLHNALMYLEYQKEKTELENKLIKQNYRK